MRTGRSLVVDALLVRAADDPISQGLTPAPSRNVRISAAICGSIAVVGQPSPQGSCSAAMATFVAVLLSGP